MAGVSSLTLSDKIGENIIFDDDCDATVVENVDSGSTDPLSAQMDSANAAITYLHLWNLSDVAIGTDPADMQFPIPATGHRVIHISGATFEDGLSFAATSDKGTTANTNPTTPPDVWVRTNGGN